MDVERLVGRDTELEAVGTWLEAAARLPSTLLIEGEPGIGKTSLLRAAVRLAHERGHRVLEAWPAQSESGLAHSGLIDLFRPIGPSVIGGLPGPQRAALAVALLRDEPVDDRPDRMAISVACLSVLEALASEGPLLLAVDDAHWLDAASADVLRFALRRLREQPVRVAVTRRAEAPPADGLGAGLPAIERLTVGPMSLGAIHAIVAAELGLALDRPRLRRLHELSGGNAFYALELGRALAAGTFSLASGAVLPPDLEDLVGHRVAALPPATLSALAAAAAASRPTIALLAAVIDGDPLPSLMPAVDAGVVRPLSAEAHAEVEFTHPLLASAAEGAVDARQRAEIHAALARSIDDVVERGRHLALATDPPDAVVAAALDEAAMAAVSRGAPASAAELAGTAIDFTPPDDERDAFRRVEAAAGYRFEAGDTGGAAGLLDALIASTPTGVDRARLLARRARIMHFGEDVGAGVRLLSEALDAAGADRRLRGEIEEGLAWGLLLARTDLPAAARHAAAAARIAESLGDDSDLAEALAATALTRFVLGRDSAASMRRALELEPATRHLRVLRHPSFAHAYVLACRDELESAAGVLLDLRERASRRGDESSTASILLHASMVELLAGRYAEADRMATDAGELALEIGQRPARAAALGRRALVAALRGEEEVTRRQARESLTLTGGPSFESMDPARALARGGEAALWAIGLLEVSLGRYEDAVHVLSPYADAMLDAGVREPGELRFLVDEVEALASLGRLDAAERRVEVMERMADRSRRRSARASARAMRGLLRGAVGDVDGAVRDLERAAADATRSPLPFLRARVDLALGRAQRRAKRRAAARATLNAALRAFEELGAARWAALTESEIGRIGGRVSSGTELTSTEASVAKLVSEGLTNREVAAALFVTPKAVEATLARVFAKRGVRSRTELAHAMATGDDGKE